MARLLFVTSDMPGMLYPAVELARRLKVSGHELTYVSPEAARRTILDTGLEFAPLAAGGYDTFLEQDGRAGRLTRLRRLASRREQARTALAPRYLKAALRDIGPDLMLIDGEMHPEIISAIGSGVPVALLNSFVSIWRQPGMPPPHCLVRPGVGWSGSRPGIGGLWWALRIRKRMRAYRLALRHVGCDRLSSLRRLARGRGFDMRRETDASQWLIPFTYTRLPVLSMHAREFEFPHRPPKRVHYVGPMLLESRGDTVSHSLRERLDAIYADCPDGERTLIFAGFGSFFSADRALLQRLIEAVASRTDWVLVLSLGGRLTPTELDRLPDNVHAFSWLPQLEVLRHARVAVTHGGINTIDECVMSGVPSLVYCGFETDMAGTTARLVHHGLGLAGDRRDSPGLIRKRIERLLLDRSFRDNVERFRSSYRTYATERIAEQVVDSMLGAAGQIAEP